MPTRKSRPPAARVPPAPFRAFLSYAELTDYVAALAAARPELCRLRSLGSSRDGRPIHLLAITDFRRGPDDDKPAYLVHANIHAGELATTHAALHTARDLVANRQHAELLRTTAFYIVPRLNPDGAEDAVQLSMPIRSRRDDDKRQPNRLYPEDIDGDGLILTMLQEHPDGDHCFDRQDPRLLRRRYHGFGGPYYRFYQEGLIHNWDGTDNIRLGFRGFDWNRNWSYDWRPEPEQRGAGDFPFSEPEMRQLGEFIFSHPNLFALLDYHTGAASFLLPPSTGGIDSLARADWEVIREIGRVGEKIMKLPAASVIHLHDPGAPDINLRGHSEDFAYHHRGIHGFGIELGTMLDSVGIDMAALRHVGGEQKREELWRAVLKWWDKQNPRTRPPLFHKWRPFDHPQLGKVLLGGFDQSLRQNQTMPALRQLAARVTKFTVAHAGWAPRVCIERVEATPVDRRTTRLRVRIANRGRLPTSVTQKGRQLRCVQPLRVEFHPSPGVELLSREGHREIGHLDAVTGARALEWFVRRTGRGAGTVEVRVFGGAGGNCREVVPIG